MNLLDAASPRSGFPVLDGIQHHDIHRALREIRSLLDTAKLDKPSVISWLKSLGQHELATLFTRSVERPSHRKWFLGGSINGYLVWLHEYKGVKLPDAVGSFAASVHNHRYSFVSQVLTGSLLVSDFSLDPVRQFPGLSGTRTIEAQSTYSVSSDDIHRIDATAPLTWTLVVQGPPERAYSRVFNLANKSFEDLYDLESHFLELVSS